MDAAAIDFDLRGLTVDTLLEWDGKIAVAAVAGGCNWRCPFCHGWRFVTGLADAPRVPLAALWALLEGEDAEWRDGVVISGGEPTLQPGLIDLAREIKRRGFAVKLHTNGSRPDTVAALLGEGLIDCLALDYKAPPDQRLAAAAGVALNDNDLDAVRRTFAMAAASGLEREYHTTLCPAFLDAVALDAMAALLAELEKGRARPGRWLWQPYEPADVLAPEAAGSARFTKEETDALADKARTVYPALVVMRGRGG